MNRTLKVTDVPKTVRVGVYGGENKNSTGGYMLDDIRGIQFYRRDTAILISEIRKLLLIWESRWKSFDSRFTQQKGAARAISECMTDAEKLIEGKNDDE